MEACQEAAVSWTAACYLHPGRPRCRPRPLAAAVAAAVAAVPGPPASNVASYLASLPEFRHRPIWRQAGCLHRQRRQAPLLPLALLVRCRAASATGMYSATLLLHAAAAAAADGGVRQMLILLRGLLELEGCHRLGCHWQESRQSLGRHTPASGCVLGLRLVGLRAVVQRAVPWQLSVSHALARVPAGADVGALMAAVLVAEAVPLAAAERGPTVVAPRSWLPCPPPVAAAPALEVPARPGESTLAVHAKQQQQPQPKVVLRCALDGGNCYITFTMCAATDLL